jgi:hypothetical protein
MRPDHHLQPVVMTAAFIGYLTAGWQGATLAMFTPIIVGVVISRTLVSSATAITARAKPLSPAPEPSPERSSSYPGRPSPTWPVR